MDDAQSKLLNELYSYLSFFRKRQELEQDYADSLRKLSLRAKTKEAEGLHEDISQIPTSWRKAWIACRNAVEDEARSHRVAAEGLGKLVTKLNTFRDNRDRIRRRVADDLRTTASEYTDYKGVVSRLRKGYERKVEELIHHEEAEALKEETVPPPLSSANAPRIGSKEDGWPPEHWTPSSAHASGYPTAAYLRKRSDSAASSKGLASDPDSPPQSVLHPSSSTPLFVSGATSSSSDKTGPYRDPPTGKSNVFENLTKRDWSGEKHRVNSIVRAVGNLAKGTDPAVTMPSRGLRSRQYGGKLKREAEQADRDYRSGIFQLETLRLQKIRVCASARESLRETVLELGTTLKSIFEQRIVDHISFGQAQVAIAEHVKPDLERIEPSQDAEQFVNGVHDSTRPDPPIYYVNAFVGECRDLAFGVSLQDYHGTHPTLLVPLIVQRCIAFVDSHGLTIEGIYRTSGKLATIQQIVTRMEQDEDGFSFGQTDDPPAVASVLKLYLRQLPTPLFPFPASDRKSFASDYSASPEIATASLIRRIRRLSPPQQATLKNVCEHLARVAAHEQVNKMGAANLGLIFSTVVFGEEETSLETALHTSRDVVMELLIDQQAHLFEGLPIELPPLARSRRPSGVTAPFASPPISSPPLASPPIVPHPPSQPSNASGSPFTNTETTSPQSHSPQVVQQAQMLSVSAPMRNHGSIDSVYALYQKATAPGVLPSYSPDSSPDVPAAFVPPPRPHPLTSLPQSQQRSSTLPSPPPPHLTSTPLASPCRAQTAPMLSPMSERSVEYLGEGGSGASSPTSRRQQEEGERPPLPPRSSTRQSLHNHFDSPPPPLSAALGRQIPSPEP